MRALFSAIGASRRPEPEAPPYRLLSWRPAPAHAVDHRFVRRADQAVPGQVQVTRCVKVKVPGKHFPGLSAAEQKLEYWVTAVEFREHYPFERHNKAWGPAHTGPGIRFVSDSDAIDDADRKGFWTTLSLWNRWRDQT